MNIVLTRIIILQGYTVRFVHDSKITAYIKSAGLGPSTSTIACSSLLVSDLSAHVQLQAGPNRLRLGSSGLVLLGVGCWGCLHLQLQSPLQRRKACVRASCVLVARGTPARRPSTMKFIPHSGSKFLLRVQSVRPSTTRRTLSSHQFSVVVSQNLDEIGEK